MCFAFRRTVSPIRNVVCDAERRRGEILKRNHETSPTSKMSARTTIHRDSRHIAESFHGFDDEDRRREARLPPQLDRSLRGCDLLIIHPMRRQSDANMDDILSEGTEPGQPQVIHSGAARSLDEGYVFLSRPKGVTAMPVDFPETWAE